MNQSPVTPGHAKPAIPLLDVLLRIREDMQGRATGPALYIGPPDVECVACFIVGYEECLLSLGIEEGTDALFGDWLRDVKKAWPEQGWDSSYLEEAGGDHERALRKYLDFVAEFRALSLEALASIPWHGGGAHPSTRMPAWTPVRSPVPTLDMLLEIRREVGDVPGRLGLFIGSIEVKRMAGLIDGYRLCLSLAGTKDEEYARFERWLQEAKGLPPGQTWETPLLQASNGNHEQAIRKLLGYVAEFRASG